EGIGLGALDEALRPLGVLLDVHSTLLVARLPAREGTGPAPEVSIRSTARSVVPGLAPYQARTPAGRHIRCREEIWEQIRKAKGRVMTRPLNFSAALRGY